MSTCTETWKAIERAPNYEVSDEGRVRRVGGMFRKDRAYGDLLTGTVTSHGYVHVHILTNDRKRSLYVHVLVLEAFVPRPGPRFQVNHRDGVKTNNVLANLEWVTASANSLHRSRTLGHYVSRGEANGNALLTDDTVRAIRARWAAGDRGTDIARELGVSPSSVCGVVRGKTWSHVS